MIVLCVFGFYMFVLVCVIPTSVLLLSLFCRVICFVVVIIVSRERRWGRLSYGHIYNCSLF